MGKILGADGKEAVDESLIDFVVNYTVNKDKAERLRKVAGPDALDKLLAELRGAFERLSIEVHVIQKKHEDLIHENLKSNVVKLYQ